jgi:8-oxo-dGTP diphosphatase
LFSRLKLVCKRTELPLASPPLVREVHEELALSLDPAAMRPVAFADEPGADGHPAIVLFLYDCRAWSGTPEPLEGQAFGWFSPASAHELPLAAMDRALLDALAG